MEILPYLYLGCAKDSTNLDVLEEFGIKYILNVTPNLPNLFENAGEFKYKQIPISDHWSQNLSQFFPEAISFIGETRLFPNSSMARGGIQFLVQNSKDFEGEAVAGILGDALLSGFKAGLS